MDFPETEKLARQSTNILLILYIHVNSETGIALPCSFILNRRPFPFILNSVEG